MTKKQFTSHASNARGLGSAKEGVSHWAWQRLSAIILIPLTLWFVFSIIRLSQSEGLAALQSWFASPLNAILAILLFGALFLHAKLGLQVVIEDYIHAPCCKITLLVGVKIAFLLAGIVSIISICKLHFFAL